MDIKKTYKNVGFSRNAHGKTVMRFTNHISDRICTLARNSIQQMRFYPLPKPMTKFEAGLWLRRTMELTGMEQLVLADMMKIQRRNLGQEF